MVIMVMFLGTLPEMKLVHGVGQILHLIFVVMGIAIVVQVIKEVISATLSRYSGCSVHPSLGRAILKPLLLVVAETEYVKRRLLLRKSIVVYLQLIKIFNFH